MNDPFCKVLAVTPDNTLVRSLRAELRRAGAATHVAHLKSPDAIAGAAGLQDWLVVDVDRFGHAVCRHGSVVAWPGQRLLVCKSDFRTPFNCLVVDRHKAASRLSTLVSGDFPSPKRLPRTRQQQKRKHNTLDGSQTWELLAAAAELNRLNRRQLAESCVRHLPPVFDMRLASYYSYDPKAGALVLECCNHPYEINTLIDLGRDPGHPMAWAIEKNHPCLIRDWETAARPLPDRPYASRYSTRSCIIIPLATGERLAGVLNLSDPADDRPLSTEQHQPLLGMLADILNGAVANIDLFERTQQQALTDALTGLGNYRAFSQQLRNEVMRSRRYGTPLSLMLLDVDGLKQVNDSLGHPAGDRLLRTVASRIVAAVRQIDLPARCGGDEFGVILPNTELEAAKRVAQRVLADIRQKSIMWRRKPLPASISVGVGQYQGELTTDEFIRSIDKALYTAKVEGKNQMAVSHEVPQPA